MKEYMQSLIKWLEKRQSSVSTIASIATSILVIFIGFQLLQAYTYKKYDNYLNFNTRYDQWYDGMPKALIGNKTATFDSLDNIGKEWVRRYFNLYAEEFYFYKHRMIPNEMWEEQIHGCHGGKPCEVFRNLKKYPALLQGYCVFKAEGAFRFPKDFIDILETDLQHCGISTQQICP